MRQIHNSGDNAYRMPLFLTKELEMEWLKPNLDDEEMARLLTYEMAADQIVFEPVFSIRGRTPRPDGQPKNAPYPYLDLPPILC
jgi:putative SOS response-associated peptidase YedK